jgi:hypothetical protein
VTGFVTIMTYPGRKENQKGKIMEQTIPTEIKERPSEFNSHVVETDIPIESEIRDFAQRQ